MASDAKLRWPENGEVAALDADVQRVFRNSGDLKHQLQALFVFIHVDRRDEVAHRKCFRAVGISGAGKVLKDGVEAVLEDGNVGKCAAQRNENESWWSSKSLLINK